MDFDERLHVTENVVRAYNRTAAEPAKIFVNIFVNGIAVKFQRDGLQYEAMIFRSHHWTYDSLYEWLFTEHYPARPLDLNSDWTEYPLNNISN